MERGQKWAAVILPDGTAGKEELTDEKMVD